MSLKAQDSQQTHYNDAALAQIRNVPGCPEHQIVGVLGVGLSEGARWSLEQSPEFVAVAAAGKPHSGPWSLQNLNNDPLLFVFVAGDLR